MTLVDELIAMAGEEVSLDIARAGVRGDMLSGEKLREVGVDEGMISKLPHLTFGYWREVARRYVKMHKKTTSE